MLPGRVPLQLPEQREREQPEPELPESKEPEQVPPVSGQPELLTGGDPECQPERQAWNRTPGKRREAS